MTDNLDSQCTQFMILRVGKCLRWSNNDRLSGMYSQWVKILHITYGDTVVVFIAYYLILNLFPTLQRLLYQHLWRECEGLLCKFVQLFLIVAKTRTQTAECVCSTQNYWVTQCGSSLTSAFDVRTSFALDGLYTNLVQFLYEELAVLSIHDCLHRSTQYLNAVLL